MSKTRSLHHIVFATKYREKSIPSEHKRDLYNYIFGITKNLNCTLLRINGMPDHIHILADINPSISISEFVRKVKQASSFWMHGAEKFRNFSGWNSGYYAFSLSENELEACKQYIINQESHHLGNDTLKELENLATRNNIRWDSRDWA